MDDLDLLRAVRPSGAYPADRAQAARDRLLTAAAGTSGPAHPAHPVWRLGGRWQAGIAAGAALTAASVAIAMTAAGPHGTSQHDTSQHGTSPRPVSQPHHPLTLASYAARYIAPPPGTRWVVTERRLTSTASSSVTCLVTGQDTTGSEGISVDGLAQTCPGQPPAELPASALASSFLLSGGGTGLPDPATLPGKPGPLLAAIYRWYPADYSKTADRLPGQQPPPLTPTGLRLGTFDVLAQMLTSGVTSPSPATQLDALAMIPGATLDTGARNALGQPGIGVIMRNDQAAAAESTITMEEVIFDPQTFHVIGSVHTHPAASGRPAVTITITVAWQAYYDASGRRL